MFAAPLLENRAGPNLLTLNLFGDQEWVGVTGKLRCGGPHYDAPNPGGGGPLCHRNSRAEAPPSMGGVNLGSRTALLDPLWHLEGSVHPRQIGPSPQLRLGTGPNVYI